MDPTRTFYVASKHSVAAWQVFRPSIGLLVMPGWGGLTE